MELVQNSLFDENSSCETISKKFIVKDVFFNNGIVNLYQFLQDNSFDIELEFQSNYLELKYKDEKVYFEILNKFFKDNKIIYQTKNDRIFFNEKRKKFEIDKKFDSRGGQKNDLRNGVYLYKSVEELGYTREEFEKLYLSFCEKNNWKIEKETNGKLKIPNKKNEVIVHITLDEAIENFVNYFVKTDILKFDSKISLFEDGQNSFHDMLKISESYSIDKWDALIYWFGNRIKRYFNSYSISNKESVTYFIYPNSSSLEALDTFKYHLKISDQKESFKDSDGKTIEPNTNINFYDQLYKDGISNTYFYISKSDVEFELKFFIYLFSKIFHIDNSYEKAMLKNKVTKRKEKIYKALQESTFVIYTEDGTFKKSLNEYTKAYQLIRFFEKIKEADLFTYFADIFVIFYKSQGSKEVNVNYQKWCKGLLEFKELKKYYYLASFNILKNDSKSFGKNLFEFEKLYLKNIMGEKNMNIHEKSKILGDSIGYFCAQLGDKDLLFKLRNVKNYKQLLSYFKDLKFASLKHGEKARFSKEFNESLEEVLNVLENEWEIVRDYIAIYAIDKYKATNYRNKMKKEGK